jgi:hypothetical protein
VEIITCAGIAAEYAWHLYHLDSPNVIVRHVNAAALKILNQVSFVDIGGANGDLQNITESFTVLFSVQGIYVYDSDGCREFNKGEANAISIFTRWKKLAFSDGTLMYLILKHQRKVYC